uniref:Uncharacterized protein n=1 Tax=Setaria digitata TaxID=48799 RepID=A0A915PQT3_9BILA
MSSDNESCSRRSNVLLPSSGVLTKDGIPFYHLRRYALKPVHLQRLKQCGIKLRTGQFSNDENERIKKNWKKYAATNNIDYSRAYEFAGGYSRDMNRIERIDLLVFQNRTNFVPTMCEGFNDRTGRQVISRMIILYHPAEKGRQEWNDELEKQFEKLYAEDYSARAISIRLQRPKAEVDYRINLLRRRTEEPCDLDNCDIQLAENFVMKWLHPKNLPQELENMLPGKEEWNVADFALMDQEKAMSYLPWLSLTWKMLRPVPVIKRFWLKEVEKLRAACKNFDGDTKKAADACMPRLPLITVGEYRRALNLFLEQKPMFPSHLDIQKLQKRIEKEDLVGYCTNGLIEAEFLKRMLCVHITNCRSVTNAEILKNFNCTDWITVFIDYLKHLDGGIKKWHYDMKYVGEIILKKLKKDCRDVPTGSSSIAVKTKTNNSFSGSVTLDKTHEDEGIDYVSCSGVEVNDEDAKASARDVGSSSFNEYSEYFTEKLRNLIESRILLFDQLRQRKYAKKLRKIMRKDRKLEALQGLVERMIINLEDEQKLKLNKKYKKIMKRIQKVQGTENDKSLIHHELVGTEKSIKCDKNDGEGDETVNCMDYSETAAELDEEIKHFNSDSACNATASLELQNERKNINRERELKRRASEDTRTVIKSCVLSRLNKLVEPIEESEYDAVDVISLSKKKLRIKEQGS